jgi:pimeloyl-ACP methyl ester carboxylesterase
MPPNWAVFASIAYSDQARLETMQAAGWLRHTSMPKSVLMTGGKYVVLAFRGTQLGDPEDVADDAALYEGTEWQRPRFIESLRFLKWVRRRYKHKQLIIVGHSLGGSLCLWGAYMTPRVQAHCYNPFASITLLDNPLTPYMNYTNCTTYVNTDDLLDLTSLFLVGPTRIIGETKEGYAAHSLENWL